MGKNNIFTAIVFCILFQLNAQKVSEYNCKKTEQKITIDGKLEEAAWKNATPIILKRNEDAGQPTQASSAKILWDYNNLYIAFVCDDKDIQASMNKKDMPLYNEEVVEAFINPDGNPMTYFEFQVNPLNTRFDAMVLGDSYPEGWSLIMGYNPDSFKSAVNVEKATANDVDQKWITEISISFKDLAILAKPALSFRMNLFRIDRSNGIKEDSASSPTFGRFHTPERFGKITLIEEKNGRIIYPSCIWKGKNDNVNAIDDGIIPEKSSDQNCPRFTWWPKKGTEEWVEIKFTKPRTLSETSVMWFDDTIDGGLCGLPKNWKIQYLDSGNWKNVEIFGDYTIKKDSPCTVKFNPVQTKAVRLSVKLKSELSAGIFEWQVK
jgi:cellulose/xylan binding protein with CBM9 domain/F5/8 type C domain-containing protein